MKSEHHLISKKKTNILLISFILMFFLSFTFIFEATYDGLENTTNITSPNKENCYFIKTSNDNYEVYLNGKYITIEESLDYYPNDIPIYDREEVKEYEED
mgnify:FL=1